MVSSTNHKRTVGSRDLLGRRVSPKRRVDPDHLGPRPPLISVREHVETRIKSTPVPPHDDKRFTYPEFLNHWGRSRRSGKGGLVRMDPLPLQVV